MLKLTRRDEKARKEVNALASYEMSQGADEQGRRRCHIRVPGCTANSGYANLIRPSGSHFLWQNVTLASGEDWNQDKAKTGSNDDQRTDKNTGQLRNCGR